MSVREGLSAIEARLREALTRAGRAPGAATLIAVTKRQPLESVVEAFDGGVRDFGENTVQELAEKAAALAALGREARWHFIGRLQKNKINKLLPWVSVVQTIDSTEVAAALAARVPSSGLDVMIQVNIGRESQKGGVDPEAALCLADELTRMPGLRLKGLMAIPPADVDPRPFFEEMARLSSALGRRVAGATWLSMGMSDDFEVAIARGATHVRVGTAIFGERQVTRGRGAA